MRKRKVFDIKLDKYEQELTGTIDKVIERDKLNRVDNLAEEIAFAREAAANYLRKDAKINIKLL